MKGGISMTIELTIFLSVISVCVAAVFGYATYSRNKTLDDRKDSSEMTTVIVKLENISTGISEIKLDIKDVKNEVKELRERVAKVEASTKSAHNRIDEIKKEGG